MVDPIVSGLWALQRWFLLVWGRTIWKEILLEGQQKDTLCLLDTLLKIPMPVEGNQRNTNLESLFYKPTPTRRGLVSPFCSVGNLVLCGTWLVVPCSPQANSELQIVPVTYMGFSKSRRTRSRQGVSFARTLILTPHWYQFKSVVNAQRKEHLKVPHSA